MKLTVLGSGTCIPTKDRGPSGLALSVGEHLILFDGGGGSLRRMPGLGLDYKEVGYYCVTHFHPDHVSDLIPFLFAQNYTVDFTRSLPLHVVGPEGLERFYGLMREAFGRWIEAQNYPLHFHEMAEGTLEFPGFSAETLPMAHSESAVGYRVSAGEKSMAYSGDTDYCAEIVRLGRDADLLILECSFSEERRKPGHLTPRLAGRIAREAQCRRLLLTHFYPVFEGIDIAEECRKEFEGEILLAADGMKIDL